MINVFQPQLGNDELNAIRRVFESNWLGKGKLTEQFEGNFAAHLGVEKANVRSTNCCSEGLFNSMKIFDIKPDDEVIMPTISFIGAGNAVRANGSKLVFCDVDKRTLNVRAQDIEKKITKNTKAIMLIHFGGVPCEMDEIMDLAQAHNLIVIEDSACSVASTYKGKAAGTIGDMGMWSFDAMKIIVCGDGSILYFKEAERAKFAEKLMYFGLESKSGYANSVDKKWWEFDISQFGHRAIMNDITASMALEQLRKLPSFIKRRQQVHDLYNQNLKDVPWLELPPELPEYSTSSHYFYHIQLEKRDELAAFLRENGIYTTFRYYPLHWVKFFDCKENFENAEWAAKHTLCIPIHHSLTDKNVEYVVEKIKQFGKSRNI
ncbi:MAG: DegT/DnrJ/EryC1/StrS family aminotransferase [Alphaproteobacteria bacterium]|nr:DegT/DnrJ/EryC1/StrS family aminotransferase [Alphaproteobacteria bacterium]